MALRIKKGDLVKIITGSHKGKTGKVVSTNVREHTVKVEKIGVQKRHIKPSQLNPRGGTKEIHKSLPLGNVALVADETKGTNTRVGYKVDKDGNKVRIAKVSGKEIK